MTYEINQSFIAESFVALYAVRGRLTLGQAELLQRYEFCEDLAQQLAEPSNTLRFAQDLSTDAVLSRCLVGLREPESRVSREEALWVIRRTAEILEWDASGWLTTIQDAASES